MVDITFKSNTHRIAIAQAVVKVSQQQTIDAVINKTVPKGDVFEMAKTAGLFAVKRTSDLIPDCHPIPIEFTAIRYKVEGLEIKIKVEIQTIYKTGVEVEAMHGASVVALTMYDMLKPIDKGIEIHSIKLLEKSGGKTDYKDKFEKPLTASVVVCSDTIAAGKKVDKAGKAIIKKLEKYNVRILDYAVISDDVKALHDKGIQLLTTNCDILIFTGGTGVSPRDNTPDVIKSLIKRFRV
jgi:cyclic pyranopterin phosphate synthase